MQEAIADLFDIYLLTPGRRIYALSQLHARALELDLESIATRAEAAIEHDKHVLSLDAARRRPRTAARVREADHEVDRIIGTIDRVLAHFARREDEAVALLDELLPEGLSAHIRQPFVDQRAANQRILDTLREPERQAWLSERGLSVFVKELEQAQLEFAEAYDARYAPKGPNYAEVKAASDEGQARYLELLAMVLAATLDQPERRAELLAPFILQEREVAALRRSRRPLVEVDPSSGQPLEDEPPLLQDAS